MVLRVLNYLKNDGTITLLSFDISTAGATIAVRSNGRFYHQQTSCVTVNLSWNDDDYKKITDNLIAPSIPGSWIWETLQTTTENRNIGLDYDLGAGEPNGHLSCSRWREHGAPGCGIGIL